MPRKKATPPPLETKEQQALVETLRAFGVECFSVPNGAIVGGRNRFGQLAKLKREGMLAGAPDLVLMDRLPDGRPVAIEMKRQKGSVISDEQRVVLLRMVSCGWAVVLAKGADDALVQLKKLGLKRLQRLRKGTIRTV